MEGMEGGVGEWGSGASQHLLEAQTFLQLSLWKDPSTGPVSKCRGNGCCKTLQCCTNDVDINIVTRGI